MKIAGSKPFRRKSKKDDEKRTRRIVGLMGGPTVDESPGFYLEAPGAEKEGVSNLTSPRPKKGQMKTSHRCDY